MSKREKHLMWLLMNFSIYRYLISCTAGRENGHEKSERHMQLTQMYIAFVKLCDPEDVDITDDDFDRVHSETQELTGYMDIVIGFPLEGRPDYDKLAPLFFDKFIELANAVLPHNKPLEPTGETSAYGARQTSD